MKRLAAAALSLLAAAAAAGPIERGSARPSGASQRDRRAGPVVAPRPAPPAASGQAAPSGPAPRGSAGPGPSGYSPIVRDPDYSPPPSPHGHRRYWRRHHHGVPWRGFYHGSDFYWMRFHDGHWWWHHPHHHAWLYWDHGAWRRPFDDGSLRPAERRRAEGSWTSPDGRRMVQLAAGEAFLYDVSGPGAARFMKRLEGGVSAVRFSEAAQGRPAAILLDLADGDYRVFDMEGRPLEHKALPQAQAGKKAPKPPEDAARPPPPPGP